MARKVIFRCLIGFLILIGTINSVFAIGEKNMLLHTNNPFFRVVYNLSGCNYQLRVNDVPVEENKEGLPISSWSSANEWLRDGKNIISIYLLPTDDSKLTKPKCAANLKLVVGNVDASKEQDFMVLSMDYKGNLDSLENNPENFFGGSKSGVFDLNNDLEETDNGDISVSDFTVEKISNEYGAGLKISRSFNLKLSLPLWHWFNSTKIADNDETKTELIEQYRKIWTLIHNKNLVLLQQLFLERDSEMAEAFYSSVEKTSIVKQIEKAMNDSGLVQGDNIPNDGVYLHVFGNGNLANITPWDGDPAIFFNYKNGAGSRSFNIIFRKSGDKWIITR